jgi:hypothetical protein
MYPLGGGIVEYRPGYVEGKTKKAFYLDNGLAKALAYRAVALGRSQSDIVAAALRRELGVAEDALTMGTKLVVANRPEAQIDWSVGYLDGVPAVGDGRGDWYCVQADTAVLNEFEGMVWHLSAGEWRPVARRSWSGRVTDSATWTDTGACDYSEGEEWR